MRVAWLLVAGLFLLRIPLYTSIPIFAPDAAAWADPLFEIGTYLLTAFLIWWERKRLADFHIDKLVLIIFIVGKPLELLLYQMQVPFTYPSRSAVYLLYLPIAIGLGIALLLARPILPKLRARLLGWTIIGILGGIALGVYVGSVIKANNIQSGAGNVTLELLVFLPIQQMLYAGIAEEPFFRGFLWGSLRKTGLKDVWIWLIPAGLFWLGHFYALTNGAPWSFWLIVPVGGLVLGLLAWRSRSIATSMLAHGLANGLGQIVGFYS
jgi:membrane protease YdiL (CAAX protease family)